MRVNHLLLAPILEREEEYEAIIGTGRLPSETLPHVLYIMHQSKDLLILRVESRFSKIRILAYLVLFESKISRNSQKCKASSHSYISRE